MAAKEEAFDVQWRPLTARPRKRSLTIAGHRTSISLEEAFWDALKMIARERNMTIGQLVSIIDAQRGATCGLSGAIRVFVLSRYRGLYRK